MFHKRYIYFMPSIWQKLKKPIMALAPMYDVTDSAFRQIIAKKSKFSSPKRGGGGPDLFFTEFVSVDGLCSEKGRAKLLRELYFTKKEKPIIAQVFGWKPENFRKVAKLVRDLGFDGIDINMGCPDRAVMKQGAGSALIKNPKLAQEIILATKEGAGKMPVSVKTRIGFFRPQELEKWAKALIEAKPSAITFHLRTTKQLSKVPAEWDWIKIPVELAKGTGIKILGNGDVTDLANAKEKVKKYGVDGIVFGRAVFGNPWLFANSARSGIDRVPVKEKLKTLVEHAKLFEKLYCPGPTNKKLFGGHTKNFAVMKKHFKAYVKGFDGAMELRAELMECENSAEVAEVVAEAVKRL